MTSTKGIRLPYRSCRQAEQNGVQIRWHRIIAYSATFRTTAPPPLQSRWRINQVIIDQNINAGEKLPNEFELAAHLNVGRGTIREAVKLLVARNCLEIRRGKGTFVVEKPGQIEDPLGFAPAAGAVGGSAGRPAH